MFCHLQGKKKPLFVSHFKVHGTFAANKIGNRKQNWHWRMLNLGHTTGGTLDAVQAELSRTIISRSHNVYDVDTVLQAGSVALLSSKLEINVN